MKSTKTMLLSLTISLMLLMLPACSNNDPSMSEDSSLQSESTSSVAASSSSSMSSSTASSHVSSSEASSSPVSQSQVSQQQSSASSGASTSSNGQDESSKGPASSSEEASDSDSAAGDRNDSGKAADDGGPYTSVVSCSIEGDVMTVVISAYADTPKELTLSIDFEEYTVTPDCAVVVPLGSIQETYVVHEQKEYSTSFCDPAFLDARERQVEYQISIYHLDADGGSSTRAHSLYFSATDILWG